ncbi:MAG: hypothetical protein J5I93_26035 [Pirellulaceae bacterium]|nr:hypothetical protein [Pirellulaceae bacterium]
MSNPVRRPPLSGLLKQHGKTVGRIEIPLDAPGFIERFNQEYARIGLSIEQDARLAAALDGNQRHW